MHSSHKEPFWQQRPRQQWGYHSLKEVFHRDPSPLDMVIKAGHVPDRVFTMIHNSLCSHTIYAIIKIIQVETLQAQS